MAITNRTLDASEQRHGFNSNFTAVATSSTLQVCVVPYNGTLDAVKVAAAGLSGSPVYDLRVLRFIVGAGVTTIAGGATSLTATAVGTSGVQSMVLAASGSTLLNLLSGDVITLTSSGANTAAALLSVAVTIKATQDIKTVYGA